MHTSVLLTIRQGGGVPSELGQFPIKFLEVGGAQTLSYLFHSYNSPSGLGKFPALILFIYSGFLFGTIPSLYLSRTV